MPSIQCQRSRFMEGSSHLDPWLITIIISPKHGDGFRPLRILLMYLASSTLTPHRPVHCRSGGHLEEVTGGTFGWMTSTNWAAQKKGGESYFFSMGELDSWWFWIWFFSMIFWKKIHCLLDDWCIFVSGLWNSFGFTDFSWLGSPRRKPILKRALSETRSTIWMGFTQASMLC